MPNFIALVGVSLNSLMHPPLWTFKILQARIHYALLVLLYKESLDKTDPSLFCIHRKVEMLWF